MLHLLTYIIFANLSAADFAVAAAKYGVDATILEGICRYESDSGRIKLHRNKNGSWDVGYCQKNYGKKRQKKPKVPHDKVSLRQGAKALVYWKRQHERFCVRRLTKTGKCGAVKGCRRSHAWFGHYNWGFRVLKNGYDKKIRCFIDNGFKKCKRKVWRKIRF